MESPPYDTRPFYASLHRVPCLGHAGEASTEEEHRGDAGREAPWSAGAHI